MGNRLYQIYKVLPGGTLFFLKDPATGSTNTPFQQPIAADRLIPASCISLKPSLPKSDNLLQIYRPHDIKNATEDEKWRTATIVKQGPDGRVYVVWKSNIRNEKDNSYKSAGSEWVDLSKEVYRWLLPELKQTSSHEESNNDDNLLTINQHNEDDTDIGQINQETPTLSPELQETNKQIDNTTDVNASGSNDYNNDNMDIEADPLEEAANTDITNNINNILIYNLENNQVLLEFS